MDSRVDVIERNLKAVEDGIHQLRTDKDKNDKGDQGFHDELLQNRRKLEVLEGFLTTLVKGKSVEGNGDLLSCTPISGQTSHNQRPITTATSHDLQLSAKKVKMPAFNREDHIGWLARADQYFHVHHTTPVVMKVSLALIYMESPTLY